MGKIIVITNPNAKKNKKAPERKRKLEEVLGENGLVIETKVPEDIQPVAEGLFSEDIDVLCICGGDGTLQHTLTALIKTFGERSLPPIAVLRGGTMNNIAFTVGNKKSAETTLSEMVRQYQKGSPFRFANLEIMKINNRYGFFFGNGLAGNFLDAYYGGKYDGGRQVFVIIAKALLSSVTSSEYGRKLFAPVEVEAFADGERVPYEKYLGIIVSTAQYIGAGFRPMYRAQKGDGHFHVIACAMSSKRFLLNLPRFYRGKPLKGGPNFDEKAKTLLIRSGKPFKYTLDGELYEDNEVRISMGPTIRFVTGLSGG